MRVWSDSVDHFRIWGTRILLLFVHWLQVGEIASRFGQKKRMQSTAGHKTISYWKCGMWYLKFFLEFGVQVTFWDYEHCMLYGISTDSNISFWQQELQVVPVFCFYIFVYYLEEEKNDRHAIININAHYHLWSIIVFISH